MKIVSLVIMAVTFGVAYELQIAEGDDMPFPLILATATASFFLGGLSFALFVG